MTSSLRLSLLVTAALLVAPIAARAVDATPTPAPTATPSVRNDIKKTTKEVNSGLGRMGRTNEMSKDSLAQVQGLIRDLRAAAAAPVPAAADEAALKANADREARLVENVRRLAPRDAKPTEATTGKFVDELQVALKPTLDTLPEDPAALKSAAGQANKPSVGGLVNRSVKGIGNARKGTESPEVAINKLEEIQGIFNEVDAQLKNPTMPAADMTASIDKVKRHMIELKVAPEQSAKVVDALSAMTAEAASAAAATP